MAPLIVVWPDALAFWGMFFWIGFSEWRIVRPRTAIARTPQDAGSLQVIIIGRQVALLLAGTALRPDQIVVQRGACRV